MIAIAALTAAGALWLAWGAWRTHTYHVSSIDAGFETPIETNLQPNSSISSSRRAQTESTAGAKKDLAPRQTLNPPARLAPPDPNRRFTDFTPEERVKFARQGHGPGG